MKTSKFGGNKDGIGFYELMVVPREIYQKALAAISENRVSDFYNLLGVSPNKRIAARSKGSRIMIIEDKLELALAVEKALKMRGYNVSYSPGKKGLDKVDKTEIDLLIIDLTLPDVDVLSICHILKDNRQTSHIPIVIINGNNEEEDIIKGLEAGADDYIGKGFSLEELSARVKAVLRTYH